MARKRTKPTSTGGAGQFLRTIFIAALIFALAGVGFSWKALVTPYKGYAGPSMQFEVKKGWTAGEIMRRLEKAGVLRDAFVPVIYVKLLRRELSPKAGIYEFQGELTPIEVLDRLGSGAVILRQVTVREGLDRFAIAKMMSSDGFGTEKEWLAETSRPDLISDLAPEAESLEGYLFPDTYRFSPGTTPRAIVEVMVANFRKHYGNDLAYITTGLTVHQTITLASIVESEAQRDDERRRIASVYLNRLRRHMLLQADPTVIYAMKIAGNWDGNIRKADLRIPSPYNTYERMGLPPGPIANAGLASLRAAADPEPGDFLYFVAKNDGSHVFSRTLDEHNHNVAIYQKQYWQKRHEQERASGR